MSYTKHDFKSGDTLYAADLNEMDEQISSLSSKEVVLYGEQNLTDEQKSQARANIGAISEVALTQEQLNEITDAVIEAQKVEFVGNIEECVDTSKRYVLPDGYIYAYTTSEKYVVENQFVQSEAKYNYRISGAGVVQSGYNGILATGLIPIPSWSNPYTVKIKGITIAVHGTLQYSVVTKYCDSTGTNIKVIPDCFGYTTVSDPNTVLEGNIYNASYTNATHVQFAICIKDGTAISSADTENLFIEFVSTNSYQTVSEWTNTGIAFISNDYEGRIVTLESDVATLKEAVKTTPSQSGSVWYAVGDSITKGYGVGADSCWVKYVLQYNGYDAEKSKNLGISGLGFAKTDPNYSKTARTVVDENDFSSVDLVTVAIGINDWKEPFSIDTVKSEMRYCFEKILTDNPYCKIIFIAPFNMRNKGSEATNWALGYAAADVADGKTLQEFIDAQKSVCAEYNIQIIDMNDNSVINKKTINTLLYDGIHPDAACHKVLGRELARRITFA